MLTEPLEVESEGYIRVPAGPGLGVEVNHEVLGPLYGAPQIEGIALYAKIQTPKPLQALLRYAFAAGIDLSFIV